MKTRFIQFFLAFSRQYKMDFFTLALITCAAYTIYLYFRQILHYFKDRGVPYAPGLPLLGNYLSVILRKKTVHQVNIDVYNLDPETKYVGFFNFNQPVLMIRDMDLIKDMSIKDFSYFPDHKTFVEMDLDPLFGGNLFGMSGDRWKEVRNLLTPAFTSSKMKTMYDLMIPCAETFLDYIEKLPEAELNMLNTKELFSRFTNDVIATCAFGIEVDSFKHPQNEFYAMGKKTTAIEGALAIKMMMSRGLPSLFKALKVGPRNEKVIGSFFINKCWVQFYVYSKYFKVDSGWEKSYLIYNDNYSQFCLDENILSNSFPKSSS